MQIFSLTEVPFIVGGTQYFLCGLQVSLEDQKDYFIAELDSINEKIDYYEGLLKKLNFSESFLNKAPIEVICRQIKIEEDTYQMLFSLNKKKFEYTYQLNFINGLLDAIYTNTSELLEATIKVCQKLASHK